MLAARVGAIAIAAAGVAVLAATAIQTM